MRRLLWNIYAWPMTVLMLVSSVSNVIHGGLFQTVDVLIGVPAWLGLHLHIWDKQFLSKKFWVPYAFASTGWDVLYSFMLHPMVSRQKLTPLVLLGLAILLPLYVALFRYAFRRWGYEKSEQLCGDSHSAHHESPRAKR